MRCLLLALLLMLALAVPAEAAVSLEKIGDDFEQPVFVAAAPGDFSRIYVVEQGGRIWVVRNGTRLSTPFADLSDVVLNSGEQGLLSMAFAPDFQTSRRFYVYYTAGGGENRVEQLTATSADRAAPGRRAVISLPVTFASNHNGGQLQFGRDGNLYLAPGDGGAGFSGNAQDMDSLLGKILRIRPGANGGYSVPAGNPFGNEIWSSGLRNPWRFSFDRSTGDLTVGDVGQRTTEEIDFVPASAGAGRGVNFGWDRCEGSFLRGSTTAPCNLGTRPVIDHFADDGWRTIVGGYVVRTATLPSLNGRYVYGDTAKGEIWSARLARPRALDDRHLLNLGGIVSFGEDAAGCIYATSYAGGVYRLVENSTQVPCPRPAGDTARPALKVKVKKRQRVRRRRPAIVYARCSEACRIKVVAKLRTRGRTVRMRTVVKSGAANQRVKLRSRLTRRARKRLRRSLALNRRTIIRIAVRASDGAGNRSRLVRRRIRVKG